MSYKYLQYAELSVNHGQHVASNATNWASMLTTAARLYKYSFDEQLLIHAQKPNATACAELPIWNRPVGRYVKKGTKGIALLDDSQGRQQLRYVFDVADTQPGWYNAKTPYIWEMKPEHEWLVQEALGGTFDEIPMYAASLAKEYIEDNLEEILHSLEGLDLETYETLLTDSTAYMIMSRCGIDTSTFVNNETFQQISSIDNHITLMSLGEGASTIAENVLRDIEMTIKRHDREQARLAQNERSNSHGREHDQSTSNPGRNNLSPSGGLSDTQHRDRRGRGQPTVTNEVGLNAEGLPTEPPQNNISELENDRQAVSPLPRDRGTSQGQNGIDDGAVGESQPNIRGFEEHRHNGLGRPHERSESPSGGSNQNRTDLQLTETQEIPEMPSTGETANVDGIFAGRSVDPAPTVEQLMILSFATEQEQISAIEEMAQAELAAVPKTITPKDIDNAIIEWNGDIDSKNFIYEHMTYGESGRRLDTAELLMLEYGGGTDGLIVTKDGADPVTVPWDKVQQRIGILIDEQRFLTPQELGYLHEQAQEQDIETAAPPRTVSPIWQSYEKIAEKHPGNILFFKVGDFYEVMGDDAHTVAQVLNLAVASRDVGLPERVPLVGLPHHSFAGYVKQLIESGHTVAVAESVDNVREHGKPSIDTPDTKTPQTPPDVVDKAPTLQPLPQIQPTTQATPQPQADLTNFHIADPHLGEGGAKTKYAYNIAAIKTLQAIESENRLATPEEQEVLSRFVGWGGLQEAFDESKTGWAKEYQELKTLLSPEEYTAARTSVLNAHYTSPTVISAMYETLERMGVNGGNILEPSMGVGNFFGLMPESMQNAKLYGVELDSVSGRIAKQLYQNADIKVTGFEKTTMPDSFFDVAVGNVPFGGFGVVDKKYDKHKFMIHDYFFAKTLDQVRPGGIVAFVTSKGTLDKANPAVRKYLAQRADLLGAVRLPSNAFLKNAGTEVTSDIIFLQKRDSIRDIEPPWVHLGHIEDALNSEQNITVNSYFVDNPHMILGNMTAESGTRMYGNEKSTSCLPIEGADLGEQLKTALSHIEGQITPLDIGLSIRDAGDIDILEVGTAALVLPADPAVKNFSYTIVDNNVYFRENSIMRPVDMPLVTLERVKGMVGLRDAAKELIDLQLYDGSDLQIATKQAELNSLYDDFTKKFGLISTNANARAFNEDSSYYLLSSLEVLDENGALERKSDIFTKRTIKQETEITSVDTAAEALAVSISRKARVDMDYMAELTGFTEDKLANDLQGVIYRDLGGTSNKHGVVPARAELQKFCMEADNEFEGYKQFLSSRPYVTADEYLSGNVREKLEFAKSLDHTIQQRNSQSDHAWGELSPQLAENIAALEDAQPKALDASEIGVRLGSTWVDVDIYQQFAYELLETRPHQQNNIKVNYSAHTGEWNISGKTIPSSNDVLVYTTYGTDRANAYKILEDALNLRDVRVYDTKYVDGKETRVLNKDETTKAMQKQDAIKEAFKEWVFKDPDRRQHLVAKYNKLFNSTRPRQYDGSHIEFAGASPEIKLRPHQQGAIARILYGGNTLLAHEVGAGKSFEMIGAAMESKRLGLCSKSMMVVPNHIIEDMAGEFMRLYPSANILVASKKDFEPKNRKKFCARIATGDYDCVIIGHSQFEKIPLSAERQERLLQEQIDDLTMGIAQLKEERGERFTIKQMEKSKKALEVRLAKLTDDSRKDDVVTFEQLGVNRLFVDEAHNYKNLFLITKMRNVAGISTSEAQKSSDLFMKCRYLDEETGNKGVIFATGTPISNSLAEMYTMQRYLQYDTLQAKGMGHFDNWASTFGETVTAVELAPEGGGYRAKTRFAKFQNLPELMTLFGEVADIKTADTLDLPRPKANYHVVVAEPTDLQREMVADLSERATAIQQKLVTPDQDNMLKVTSDGRKIGLDQRLMNPLAPDDPNSKVNLCMENVYDIWEKTTDKRLTQVVFCDFSTPNKDGRFNVYDDIRDKLVAKGVPKDEIAFIHDFNTETQKKELFTKVRSGKVRVLFGSTAKCGAGTNIQDRLVALHDLDCPWRPADLAQRAGRIERQGNQNPEVDIFRYVTDSTFDSYLFQTVQKKQEFISQIMTSKSPVRTCDDMDEQALSYAEIKALCAGNPLIAEKMGLDVEVAKLKMLKASHQSQQYRLEDNLRLTFPAQIESSKAAIEGYKSDVARLEANTHKVEDGISPMTIGASNFTERKDAGAALMEACQKTQGTEPLKVGSYRGFEMTVFYDTRTSEYKCQLKGVMTHSVALGTDPGGNITRIDNALEKIPATLDGVESKLQSLYSQVENAKIELAKPFPQETELAEKSARLTELDNQLTLDSTDKSNAPKRDENSVDGEDSIAADGNTPEKILAAKDTNAQLSGDETTPQTAPAPQPQYLQAAAHTPQTTPLTEQRPTTPTTHGQGKTDEIRPTGYAAILAKREAQKEETRTAAPPPQQTNTHKKNHDERS